jgi:hypothetical protein
MTWASVTTSKRPVFCALGMVLTAGELFALTWQPAPMQKP